MTKSYQVQVQLHNLFKVKIMTYYKKNLCETTPITLNWTTKNATYCFQLLGTRYLRIKSCKASLRRPWTLLQKHLIKALKVLTGLTQSQIASIYPMQSKGWILYMILLRCSIFKRMKLVLLSLRGMWRSK